MILPINVEEVRGRVQSAIPFPHFVIDNFLDPDFARQVHESFPSYDAALKLGRSFSTVNEKKKVQITDTSQFPAPASN